MSMIVLSTGWGWSGSGRLVFRSVTIPEMRVKSFKNKMDRINKLYLRISRNWPRMKFKWYPVNQSLESNYRFTPIVEPVFFLPHFLEIFPGPRFSKLNKNFCITFLKIRLDQNLLNDP